MFMHTGLPANYMSSAYYRATNFLSRPNAHESRYFYKQNNSIILRVGFRQVYTFTTAFCWVYELEWEALFC